ncbi:MAG: hypothetical protein JO257_24705 [Deltaproteobacteria bacterium]|nr:hypothetical protein [Deltaproteobacteria bacterium]
MRAALLAALAACGGSGHAGSDAPAGDAAGDVAVSDAPASSALGTVSATPATCPQGMPATAQCQTLTVTDCPGIESESITATVGVLAGSGAGTIVHFSGGGGEGVENTGAQAYAAAGFRQVFVAWATDWEQTTSAGIKTAACRPATVLQWAFDTLHGRDRTKGFCGQGFSGGSGQLGYALATYGMGAVLDYVNELSGPPFARIDLGCDGNAAATATVCGASVTMRLPSKLDSWENIPAPNSCGATTNTATEIARWRDDSIAVGGVYAYPNTRVEFFDCTNQATAVTGMAQLYEMQITSTTAYHCYSQADGCQGEGLGSGAQQAVAAMQAGCVARH